MQRIHTTVWATGPHGKGYHRVAFWIVLPLYPAMTDTLHSLSTPLGPLLHREGVL